MKCWCWLVLGRGLKEVEQMGENSKRREWRRKESGQTGYQRGRNSHAPFVAFPVSLSEIPRLLNVFVWLKVVCIGRVD